MIKTKSIIATLALMSLAQQAAVAVGGHWIVGGADFSVDTLYHATVGPGTTLTQLRVTGPIGGVTTVNNLFYTTVELANPNVEMRVAKAGNSMRALETVPEIAARHNTNDGETYFAGINADFFNMSYPYLPLGATIANGSFSNSNAPAASADIDDYFLWFDPQGVPTLSRHVTFDTWGTVTYPDGGTYSFKVNDARGTDELIIYTPQWQFIDSNGKRYDAGVTGTNPWGDEVALMPVEGRTMWGNNLTLEVVSAPEHFIGCMTIPTGGFVLSGHGKAIPQISALKVGDRINVTIGAKADGVGAAVRDLVGGYPFILRGGAVQPTLSYPGHLANPEPRTAVGYNADKTRLTMLVVDGRNAGGSAGVSQQMLARFISCLGCTEAMNFDGGGSSTMYIDALGVRNIPSSSSLDNRPEGKPRTVVNSLFAVAVAPADKDVASIEIREKRVDLVTGEQYTPTVYGYNKYGVLVNKDLKGYSVNIAPELCTVNGTTLTARSGQYRGPLTVSYNGATHSVPVYLNGADGEYVVTGIGAVAADDDVEPVYYNMQGMRIAEPAPGTVVIERRGSQVTKRLVR